MSLHDIISMGELVSMLGTGAPWSAMAETIGFRDGSSLRRHCHTRGLWRFKKHGVVIIEFRRNA